LWAVAGIVALCALTGVFNGARSTRYIAKAAKSDDPPHWTDLWGYGVGPTALYLALSGVAWALAARMAGVENFLAVVLVLLTLMGIRNAWDLITWMAPASDQRGGKTPPANPESN
jgi:hypothetical protein